MQEWCSREISLKFFIIKPYFLTSYYKNICIVNWDSLERFHMNKLEEWNNVNRFFNYTGGYYLYFLYSQEYH